MKQQITRLLLLLGAFHLLPTVLCESYEGYNFDGRHHTGPYETNVFWSQLGPPPPEQLETTRPTSTPSPGGVTASTPTPAPSPDLMCVTNQDGFGGAIGTDIFTVQYSYELELTPNRKDSLENILFKLERSIADMVLETTDFRNVPCDGRRLVEHPVDSSTTNTRGKRRRKLAPVGLSINPRDQLNVQLQCETKTPPNECILIDGAFQVFTVGDSKADEKLPTILLEKLKDAMNNGDFDGVHSAIVRVTYVDINSISGTDELNNGNEPDRVRANVQDQGPNSGLIIGASVAALFVLGALVFYRRRRMSKNDEDALGDMPADSVNSNVI